MKPASIVILIVAVCSTAHSQGITLNAGDSYTYEFSSLPLQDTTPYVFLGGHTAFGFEAASLTPGYAAQFDVFENSVSETPLFTSVRTEANQFVGADLPGHWLDFQGVICFTMLTGSANLNWLDFDVFMPLPTGGSAVYHLDFVPVPEPSVIALWTIATTLFVFGRRVGFGPMPNQGAAAKLRGDAGFSGRLRVCGRLLHRRERPVDKKVSIPI